MQLVNHVVPLRELEAETLKWCRRIMQNSPTALACLKAALNADEDGAAGCVVGGSSQSVGWGGQDNPPSGGLID